MKNQNIQNKTLYGTAKIILFTTLYDTYGILEQHALIGQFIIKKLLLYIDFII